MSNVMTVTRAIKWLDEFGCVEFKVEDNRISYTCPNGSAGMLVWNHSRWVEYVDGEQVGEHVSAADLINAWLEGGE